jgi:hypothetical protein
MIRAWMRREHWLIWITAAVVLTMVLAAIGYLASSV